MNKERIQNVIKALRETPHKDHFDMSAYGHPCGTGIEASGTTLESRDGGRTLDYMELLYT